MRHASSTVTAHSVSVAPLTFDIGDAEATAEHQLGQVRACGERGHHVGGAAAKCRRGRCSSRRGSGARRGRTTAIGVRSTATGGVAVGQVEAELRVVLSGGDVLVGVGVDAGRDAQQHVGNGRRSASCSVEAIELVEAVDDDVPHADLRGGRSSSMLLLLPWNVQQVGSDAAARATCSSPPLATSSDSPSSTARRAIAPHRNAFVA